MVKFAQVGYGTQGQGVKGDGSGYTYIVNDNVRQGDILQVAVIHHGENGTIFGTTGKVLEQGITQNLDTKKGKQIVEDLKNAGKTEADIQSAYRPKDIGIGRKGEGASTHDADGKYVASEPALAARGASIKSTQASTGKQVSDSELSKTAVDTFESYTKKYIGGNP